MNVSIGIQGLDEFERGLRDLGAVLGVKTLRSALRDAAKPMHEEMVSRAPVGSVVRSRSSKGGRVEIRPGFLKSRVKIRGRVNLKGAANKKFGKDTSAVVQVGVFRVPYVVPVEFGTSSTAATPFIRSSFESRSGESVRIFKGRLSRRIELARKRIARRAAKK